MNKKQLGLVMAAALGLAATPASAIFVTDWSWTATLEWTSAGFSTGSGTTSVTPNVLSWGATDEDYTDNTQPASASRSALEIEETEVTGSVTTNGGPVDSTKITHYNNEISIDFATLESATLLTTLVLSPTQPNPPYDGTVDLPLVSVTFSTLFTETPNSTPCGFPVNTICDDIFVVPDPSQLSGSFDFAGVTYSVELFADGLGELDALTCAAAGVEGGGTCFGLTTDEFETSPVQFGFKVTSAVPEPATVALLGLGLVGLGAASATRRRRRDQK